MLTQLDLNLASLPKCQPIILAPLFVPDVESKSNETREES
jgi:hypothetical protein